MAKHKPNDFESNELLLTVLRLMFYKCIGKYFPRFLQNGIFVARTNICFYFNVIPNTINI